MTQHRCGRKKKKKKKEKSLGSTEAVLELHVFDEPAHCVHVFLVLLFAGPSSLSAVSTAWVGAVDNEGGGQDVEGKASRLQLVDASALV